MNPNQTVKQFLNQYGCTIRRVDGGSAKGLCTRVDGHHAEVERLSFDYLGYTVKREYLLITDPQSTVLQQDGQVLVNQKRLQIISVDDTCYQDEVLCRRAYAFEVKGGLK